MRFDDRGQAGRLLARRLTDLRARKPVVLAITTGGVTVAQQVAQRLSAPLDVLLVERLQAPDDRAITLGAAAEDGTIHLAEDSAARAGIPSGELRAMAEDAARRAARRGRVCRRGRPVIDLHDRTVIIVDDGAITGHSLLAAVHAVKAHGASEVHIAVPTSPQPVLALLRERVEGAVSLQVPSKAKSFDDVYLDDQTPDVETIGDLLADAGAGGIILTVGDGGTPPANDLLVPVSGPALFARLRLPPTPTAAILFAGADIESLDREMGVPLSREGCVTLSFEPPCMTGLGEDIELTDLHRSAAQLVEAARWLRNHLVLGALPVAYVGWGIAGAAALRAAARSHGLHVVAVVARSGRPDLARDDLDAVTAPTLLLVSAGDKAGLRSHTAADSRLTCEHDLITVPDGDRKPDSPDPAVTLVLSWLADRLRLRAAHPE